MANSANLRIGPGRASGSRTARTEATGGEDGDTHWAKSACQAAPAVTSQGVPRGDLIGGSQKAQLQNSVTRVRDPVLAWSPILHRFHSQVFLNCLSRVRAEISDLRAQPIKSTRLIGRRKKPWQLLPAWRWFCRPRVPQGRIPGSRSMQSRRQAWHRPKMGLPRTCPA